jgi:hypothetical protein
MARTLTAANAIITLAVTGVFDTPQQLQGFAADDIFNTPAIEAAEVSMGVDGVLSGGFVFKEIKQDYNLQADSLSNDIFDGWYAAQKSGPNGPDLYFANGNAILFGVSTKYAMIRGILTSYTPVPSAGKILKPRKYEITWNTIVPNPL